MKPPSVMKLSPGIYSKKESYKTDRIRQILPFKLRPLTAHIRMDGTYRAWLFENRIDLEIIEICFIYQTPIMFKAARTPTLLKAGTTLSARVVPSAPLFLHVDSNVWKTIRF